MPCPSPAVPLAQSVGQFDPVADALIDRVVVTCRLNFSSPPPGGAPSLRARLADAGLIAAGSGPYASVAFAWTCPHSGEPVDLGGALRFVEGSQGAVVTVGSSHLDLNPLRMLRAQVEHGCGPGLDGGLNVVGPADNDRPHLLGLQLVTVAGLVDAFLAACALASGSSVSAEMWVRAAELNRDLSRAGAPAIARRLAREPNPWHRVGWARHHAAEPDPRHDGNYATVTWPNDRKDAPIRMKFYAKTDALLRTEVCYDNRNAVSVAAGRCDLAWPAGAAVDGAGVAERLRVLAHASVPLLDAMETHVGHLAEPQREVLDLMVALAPLLRSAAPPPPRRPGPRPRARTKDEVRDALMHLLDMGRFDASALLANGTVRKALDRIVAEGGLLRVSMGRPILYTVPPRFLAAREALSGLLWPDTRADDGRGRPRHLAGVGRAE
jgi:hypothetical protein